MYIDLQKKQIYYIPRSRGLQKIKFICKNDMNDTHNNTYNDYQEFVTLNKKIGVFIILRKSYHTGLVSIYSVQENSINASPIEEEQQQLIYVEMNLKYEFNTPEYINQEILGIQSENDKLYIILTQSYISLYLNQLRPQKHVISHESIFKPRKFSFTPKSPIIIINPCECQFIFFYRNAYFHKIYKNQQESEQTFILHAKQIDKNILKEYNFFLQVPVQLKTMEYEEILEAQIQSIYKDDAKVSIQLAFQNKYQIIILHYEGQFENNYKFELKNEIFQTSQARNWLFPIKVNNQNTLHIAYQNLDSNYCVESFDL